MPEIWYCAIWELTESERRRLVSEVEARNTVRRANMTSEERHRTPPWETEDVEPDRQIVLASRCPDQP